MKKLIFTLALVFLVQLIFSQHYSLRVGDPRNSWSTRQGSIEEAILTMKPSGLFMEYGLYLTFSAAETSYGQYDSLEVVLNFALPENAMVTDSWLWINDNISKGKLIDRWSASQIYEDIVDRRKDPSILTKVSENQYELRVFPMAGNKSRKVKITYLLPLTTGKQKVEAHIPYQIFNTTRKYLPYFDLILWESEVLNNPTIEYPFEKTFTELVDEEYGKYYFARLPNDSALSLVYDAPYQNGYYLGTYPEDEENGYYQMAILPGYYIDIEQNQKITFLVDFESGNCQFSIEDLFDDIEVSLRDRLTPKDSFNILVSGLQIQPFAQNWVPASPENITAACDFGRENLANYSNLLPLLEKGINFVNETSYADDLTSSLVLISNGNQFSDYESSNELLGDILEIMNDNFPIHVVDYQSKNLNSYYVGGFHYVGNEYFYRNLTNLTFANYIRIYGSELSHVEELMNELFNDLKGVIDHSALNVHPEEGYTFAKYHLSSDQSNSLDEPMIQIGRYHGKNGFIVVLNGAIQDEFFSHQLVLSQDEIEGLDAVTKQLWGGFSIGELEATGNHSNETKSTILEKSMEFNVLAVYTAFLCLEDTSQYCSSCLDETDLVDVDETADPDTLFQVFPNPFQDVLKIKIALDAQDASDQVLVKIIDMQGQVIRYFKLKDSSNMKEWEISWQADDEGIKAGIYLVNLIIGGAASTIKVLKLD